MEYSCRHEGDIATVINTCQATASDIRDIKEAIQNIYKVLNGNGEHGLVTRVAVQGFWLKIAWTMVFLHTTSLLGIGYFIIKKGLIM